VPGATVHTTTSLIGTVSDSSGRSIAGAKITAVDTATRDNYSAVTNQDGNYRIDFVRIGTYDVSAEFAGFTRVKHAGSVVSTNQVVRNDFTLAPAQRAIMKRIPLSSRSSEITTWGRPRA
jgi:hypothetical protein